MRATSTTTHASCARQVCSSPPPPFPTVVSPRFLNPPPSPRAFSLLLYLKVCEELLVDLFVFRYGENRLLCGRHWADQHRPRCTACDETIFADDFTFAEDSNWHVQHFCCEKCDKLLVDEEYVAAHGRVRFRGGEPASSPASLRPPHSAPIPKTQSPTACPATANTLPTSVLRAARSSTSRAARLPTAKRAARCELAARILILSPLVSHLAINPTPHPTPTPSLDNASGLAHGVLQVRCLR